MLPLSLERLANVPSKQPHGLEEFSIDREGFADAGGATKYTLGRTALDLDIWTTSSIGPMVSRCVITDGDLARIGQAATSILHEESSFGRWIHSLSYFLLWTVRTKINQLNNTTYEVLPALQIVSRRLQQLHTLGTNVRQSH